MARRFAVLLLAALAGCYVKPTAPSVGPVPAGPPPTPDRFVFSPSISTAIGDTEAGTSFAARLEGIERPVIVTCLHIFGEAGGLPRDIAAADLPGQVRKVGLADRFTGDAVGEASQVIPIPDAASLGEPSSSGDIVALWAPSGLKAHAAPFARGSLPPGSPVWLIARVPNDRGNPPRRLHPAKVVGIVQGLLEYRFDDPAIELRATSGAPVVDGDGAVVGIHLGGGKQGTATVGVANPVETFLPKLRAAAEKSPAK